NYLKNSLRYDFKLPYFPSASIATLVPLALFLVGFREFVAVLGIVGIVMGIVEGILIVMLFYKAKANGNRAPEYSLRLPSFLPLLVALLLVGGALADLFFAYGR
ncbi:MAG: hypothetical protein Q8P12_01300, partial [bacterium]|nr:hypothetical protein [bacterium]